MTNHEVAHLKSQIATSNEGRGGTRKLPLAFTEHGTLMAATILNSRRAIEVSVYVIRAIGEILRAIRQLMTPPDPPRKRGIGFVRDVQ